MAIFVVQFGAPGIPASREGRHGQHATEGSDPGAVFVNGEGQQITQRNLQVELILDIISSNLTGFWFLFLFQS